ncbi:glycosyltransferase family 4 protein [Halobacteriaceae archaeon GCM10025711]
MRVIYVVGQDAGGLPHYTAELANAVAEHADVTVMKPTDTTADELFADGVEVVDAFSSLALSMPKIHRREVHPFDVARGILSYDNVKEIRRMDADLVHDTTDLFPQVKFFLKRHGIDRQKPLVVTRHEVELNRFSLARPTHLVENAVHALLPDLREAQVVVHTESQRRALIRHGRDPETIEVIPHGAYSVFGDYRTVETDPEENCLLFFGNVIPQKGIETLVEAIPRVARDVPDVKLVVAGDGQIPPRARSTIREYSRHFELHNRFIPNEQVREFFARAEAVVLPYHEQAGSTKGHSGVLATAVSFGKPVVASTAGDFPSLVEQSGSGVVVPPRDPDRLATAIARVLDDDEARREMAANSREMGTKLSWENIAERHVELYERIIRDS